MICSLDDNIDIQVNTWKFSRHMMLIERKINNELTWYVYFISVPSYLLSVKPLFGNAIMNYLMDILVEHRTGNKVFLLQVFLRKIIKDCVTLVDFRKRKTINLEDVRWSLENNGVRMYGIEGMCNMYKASQK